MKKLLSLLLISGIAIGAQAQDKKFQIGLVLGPTFNWTKVQTQEIERNGIGAGFTIGVGGNYLFNENVGLAGGVQFDLESFKINYGDAVTASPTSGRVFYGYDDTDIKKYKDGEMEDLTDTSKVLELTTRKYRAKYVTIPFFLKFQTNMIGKFKYYGKFGLRTSILAAVRMDDEGYAAHYSPTSDIYDRNADATTTNTLNTNMKPVSLIKGLNPVRLGIGIYGGAEWNFTGSTFLYWEAGFNYGILPGLQIKSTHLLNQVATDDGSGNFTYSDSQLDIKNNPQHIFEIKMGLLF
jgi:hypothetical protein